MTRKLDSLWVVMIEDVAKEIEGVVVEVVMLVEVVVLVEVEVVMQIDGVDFCGIIVANWATSVVTTGLLAVVPKVRIQVLTMKVAPTLTTTSLGWMMHRFDVRPEEVNHVSERYQME